LSEDDGKTWKYQMMIDERDWVSYPDAVEAEDGYIYIVYDRERGGSSLKTTYAQAREILMAKITEEDIIAGGVKTEGSELRILVSKLGKYAYEDTNPYEEPERYSDLELAEMLLNKHSDSIVDKIFEFYPVNCINMRGAENTKLDMLIESFEKGNDDKVEILCNMVSLIRSVSKKTENDKEPLVSAIKDIIMKNPEEDLTIIDLAKKLGVSRYYMIHQFKKITGTTIVSYKQGLKLSWAKRLLVTTELSMTEIALKCGFGSSSYFSKMFLQSEKVSPTEYRKNLKSMNKKA